MGVTCAVDDDAVCVGSRELMAAEALELCADADAAASELEARGVTVVLFGERAGGRVRGLVGVSDVAKPDARAAVRALGEAGIDVWMASGDNEATARAIGRTVGIRDDRVLARLKPADKVALVRSLQAEGGRVVAMVGDGVNDAPALAQADLGIALGAGTDIAVDAAGMVLMRDELSAVPAGIELSRATYRRIRLNFVWALGFNMIGEPAPHTLPASSSACLPFHGGAARRAGVREPPQHPAHLARRLASRRVQYAPPRRMVAYARVRRQASRSRRASSTRSCTSCCHPSSQRWRWRSHPSPSSPRRCCSSASSRAARRTARSL